MSHFKDNQTEDTGSIFDDLEFIAQKSNEMVKTCGECSDIAQSYARLAASCEKTSKFLEGVTLRMHERLAKKQA